MKILQRTKRWFFKMSRIVLAFSAVPALLLASCSQKTKSDWPAVKQLVRNRFPEVHQISTGELSEWLSKSDRPILLDARAPEEFAVSHLQGAHLATSKDEAMEEMIGEPKDRPIVVYCSVGYRSSALAEKLMSEGFTNVHNLEGSIFAWANEGRPLYSGERQVKRVHPYDSTWGRLLDKQLWSFSPESNQ